MPKIPPKIPAKIAPKSRKRFDVSKDILPEIARLKTDKIPKYKRLIKNPCKSPPPGTVFPKISAPENTETTDNAKISVETVWSGIFIKNTKIVRMQTSKKLKIAEKSAPMNIFLKLSDIKNLPKVHLVMHIREIIILFVNCLHSFDCSLFKLQN